MTETGETTKSRTSITGSPKISLIVAMSSGRVIGDKNGLPWHLPADLAHFKLLTYGKTVLMGRKTFESIGRPLAGRKNLVLSRTRPGLLGVEVVSSVAMALSKCQGPELMVIGGGQVYRDLLPVADRVYLTTVNAHVVGDTMFPALPREHWRLVKWVTREADERNFCSMSFEVWDACYKN